ncbi:hypothetical protein GQ457_17G007700 [Hibiscus cannabinus]
MDSELLSAMGNLNFTAEEAVEVIPEFPSDEEDSSLWLVGSVVTLNPVNGDSVMRIFRSVWKAKNIHEMVELRPNFFLIKPSTADARDTIVKRRPWVIHDEFFSVKPYEPALNIDAYSFLLMTIWVRVYRLPLRAMNRDMGLRLGSCVGKALGVDHRAEGGNLGEFLRHNLAACSSKPPDLDEKKLQYGSWLRVQTQQPRPGPRKHTGIEYFSEPSSEPPAPVITRFATVNADSGTTPVSSSTISDGMGADRGMAVATEDPSGQDTTGQDATDRDTPGVIETLPTVPAVATTLDSPEAVPKATTILTPSVATAGAMQTGGSCSTVVLSEPSKTRTAVCHALKDPKPTRQECAVEPKSKGDKDMGPMLHLVHFAAHLFSATSAARGELQLEGGKDMESRLPLVKSDALSVSATIAAHGETQPEGGKSMGSVLHLVNTTVTSVRATSVARGPKRTIQGRYEVCCPIQPNRARVLPHDSSTNGLGSPATVQSLGNFIAQHDPDLVFLCETRLKQSSSSRIQHVLNMNGCFVVDYGNGCTGLMILWNRKINNKHLTWSTIDRLRSSSALPWLVGGDINEILSHSEKEGVGASFWERLDRYLATTDWFTLFPEYRVSSFYTAKSDHCFLLMDTTQVTVSVKGGVRDYFCFDSCWSKEEACIERVRSSWLHSSGSTVSRLQAIGDSLRSWQADRRVSSTKRMSDLQGFLNSCMQGTITDEAKTAFLEAKREHKSLLDKDEAYWAQRARVTWLTQGDRNTAYFHARASGRRKKNRIRGLFGESGIWTDKQAEVAGVAMRYFSTFFSFSQPTPNSTLLSNIVHCISSDDNSSLLRPFTDVEILAAFQDMNPMKAPGIDGLPGSFFRQHWELIGPDILRLCHDLLTCKIDMSCVNVTVITLIPKLEDPVHM